MQAKVTSHEPAKNLIKGANPMTSSEYKNTIEWTLKHSDENSDPEKVQRILRNLGTPFPQSDSNSTETIISLLSSGDYMGWNPCSKIRQDSV